VHLDALVGGLEGQLLWGFRFGEGYRGGVRGGERGGGAAEGRVGRGTEAQTAKKRGKKAHPVHNLGLFLGVLVDLLVVGCFFEGEKGGEGRGGEGL
jgi:hypothetical protein